LGIIVKMHKTCRSIVTFIFWALILAGIAPPAFGLTVNRLNGGANILYIDFSIAGSVSPLELIRSYNSITALSESNGWSGAFGWGWTTAFETTLTTTPERNVLLRDGSTGNTILFKSEREDPKVKETYFENIKRAYFEKRLGRKVEDSELEKNEIPEKILTRLKSDPQYRAELAIKYGIKSALPKGETLISSEYGYQTLLFKENHWVRDKDGVTQIFDGDGRLTRQIDKNGIIFDYKYSKVQKLQLVEIKSGDGASDIKFMWRQDRVVEAIDSKNHRARYTYDGLGNLTQVSDSTNQNYIYRYENKKFNHLLTKIEYPNEGGGKEKIFRELRYDDNGLVVYHREKDNSETTYQYGKKPNDPENDFWTKSTRKTAVNSVEEYDEYFIKSRTDGTKYLYKQDTQMAGVTTITLFTACCGKPSQITKNGEVTNYKYYESGLLSERVGPKEDVKLEYDPKWKKVTKVNQNGFISTYAYDNRGNLVKASNTRNQRVSLKYDRFGRIFEMTDPENRQITFKYGDQGKPTVIAEKGVGTIRIDYDNDGRIARTETMNNKESGGRRPSEAKSQEVIRRVMKGFQQLLDIIRPAGINVATTG
jgi:YD repeat-containing protein